MFTPDASTVKPYCCQAVVYQEGEYPLSWMEKPKVGRGLHRHGQVGEAEAAGGTRVDHGVRVAVRNEGAYSIGTNECNRGRM